MGKGSLMMGKGSRILNGNRILDGKNILNLKRFFVEEFFGGKMNLNEKRIYDPRWEKNLGYSMGKVSSTGKDS